MPSTSSVLAALAHRSDGVIIASEALSVGLTRDQIRAAARRGELQPLYPNVWAHSAVRSSERQRLRAALAASGGTLSHRTAGHLHGLLLRPPRLPELTVPPHKNFHPAGVVVYRHDTLDAIDICDIDGLRGTTPVRTITDLGTRVTFTTLLRAVERGLRLGLFTIEDLERALRRLARRGRNGVGPLRALLDSLTSDLAPTDSELELLLWEVIQRYDLPTPTRQFEVVIDGKQYFIDVAYPRSRIAIEGDGFGVHTERSAFEKDRTRQNALILDGWLILRFTWQQLTNDPAAVARTIRQALDARPPWRVHDPFSS